MFRMRFAALGGALALVLSAPLTAKIPTAEELAALSDEQLFADFENLQKADNQSPDLPCEMAVYVDEFARRKPDERLIGFAGFMNGLCDHQHGEFASAVRNYEIAEARVSSEFGPDDRMELEHDVLRAAVQAGDPEAFGRHANHVVERGWPDEFAKLDPDVWFFGLSRMKKADADALALRFVRSASFAHLPAELQESFTIRAVRPAMQAGDNAFAARLATRYPDPYSVLGFLIDRDFEAIWPELEAEAGPHIEKVFKAQVDKARGESVSAPDDMEKLSALVLALQMANDHEGAIAAAAKVDHSPAAAEDYGEYEGWVINYEIMSLDQLGRLAEGDALFDRIGTLDSEQGRGWVVSFAINRADRLVGMGRWAEALPASELAVKVASKHGNGYAKEAAAAGRYCAAYKLDPKRPELAGWWAEIEKNWNENPSAAVVAAQCKGDIPAARRLLRMGLEDPETRPAVLRLLQPNGFALFRDVDSVLEQPYTLLAGDPALTALFRKYGRVLPDKLLPYGPD